MEDHSAIQDELISRNRSYRDLQTSWLDFGGNLATPLFRCEGPRRRHESFPRAGWGGGGGGITLRFRLPLRLRPAHMESGLHIFHASNFCRCSLRCRAAHINSRHYTTLSVKTKKSMASLAVTKTPANFFYDFRSLVNIA